MAAKFCIFLAVPRCPCPKVSGTSTGGPFGLLTLRRQSVNRQTQCRPGSGRSPSVSSGFVLVLDYVQFSLSIGIPHYHSPQRLIVITWICHLLHHAHTTTHCP